MTFVRGPQLGPCENYVRSKPSIGTMSYSPLFGGLNWEHVKTTFGHRDPALVIDAGDQQHERNLHWLKVYFPDLYAKFNTSPRQASYTTPAPTPLPFSGCCMTACLGRSSEALWKPLVCSGGRRCGVLALVVARRIWTITRTLISSIS